MGSLIFLSLFMGPKPGKPASHRCNYQVTPPYATLSTTSLVPYLTVTMSNISGASKSRSQRGQITSLGRQQLACSFATAKLQVQANVGIIERDLRIVGHGSRITDHGSSPCLARRLCHNFVPQPGLAKPCTCTRLLHGLLSLVE